MSASFCNPGDSCDGQPETPHKNREMILVGRRFTERFAKAKRSVQEFESPMDHHVGASYVSLAPIYFISQSALAQLLLLFRKKSHSAHRPGCKRPPGGSLPLPTFCELEGSNPTIKIPKISFSVSIRLHAADIPKPSAGNLRRSEKGFAIGFCGFEASRGVPACPSVKTTRKGRGMDDGPKRA